MLENVRLNGLAERNPAAGEALAVSSCEVGLSCDDTPGAERNGSEGPRARVGVPERVGGLLGGARPDRLAFLCGGGRTGDFAPGSLDDEEETVATGNA